MSRRRFAAIVPAAVLACSFPLAAQDGATGSPPERIDLTITATSRAQRAADEACERRREDAILSGEIVVCGGREGDQDQRYSSREDAQNRYAAATMGPSTPDVAGAGIFRGPPTLGGICVPGIFNCPKPLALVVDVTKLPQAPPGSDADRIARGLAPLGDDVTPGPRRLSEQERAELGLPASPAGSAAPAAPQ